MRRSGGVERAVVESGGLLRGVTNLAYVTLRGVSAQRDRPP
jgi:hypothetical protein